MVQFWWKVCETLKERSCEKVRKQETIDPDKSCQFQTWMENIASSFRGWKKVRVSIAAGWEINIEIRRVGFKEGF